MAEGSKFGGSGHTRIVRLGDRQIVSEGLARGFWTDIHHRAMTASWPIFFSTALCIFIALNFTFATIFWFGHDPIANAEPGNLLMYFFFSVETLATVGYGDMHPQSFYAHVVATCEIFTGISLIAVMTGLIFSRFSRPRARFLFAKRVVVGVHDGRQTLMLRLANARQNRIAEATARLWLLTTEATIENRPYRRFRELKLIRNENPMFALSWTLFHVIEGQSPMWGLDAAGLKARDAGLLLTVSGIDEQLTQQMQARQSYSHTDIAWGSHFADILSTDEAGRTRIDFRKIDDVEADLPAAKDALEEPAMSAP